MHSGHFLCAGGKLAGMDQLAINEAVKNCVREALGEHEPLLALQRSLDELNAAGWSNSDIEIVRNTCLRMLKVIYDADGSEERDQTK
jgi:hypothetical protein